MEVVKHILLGIAGFSGGSIIALALVALFLELNLIPRYAEVTHTAHRMKLYEISVMAGAFLGNLAVLFTFDFSFGMLFGSIFGLFSGIHVGCWIIALAEILDIFPVMFRKIQLKKGIGATVLAAAIGKTLFSLLYYYKGW